MYAFVSFHTGTTYRFFAYPFSFNRVTSEILVYLGDNYEANTSSEETEALFVIVLEYGTVKSFAIRDRGVQFPEMTQNTSVSLISKFSNF